MKINEVIREKYVKRDPEEDQIAQTEFNLLKRVDPDFADKFMNAYNEFGNVDAAYEKARRETLEDRARKRRQLKKMFVNIKRKRGLEDKEIEKRINSLIKK